MPGRITEKIKKLAGKCLNIEIMKNEMLFYARNE